MKIAHIAPPWLAIPPKNYGGTENVIYTLVEEQVAQGHDVTLFAPGDAKTSANLVSFFPQSILTAGESWQSHLKAYYHFHSAVEALEEQDFDVVHMHLSSASDLYLFPLTASLAVPTVTTLHSPFPFDITPKSRLGKADEYYMQWLTSAPMVAISQSAKDAAPDTLNFVGVVYHGLPVNDATPTKKTRSQENFLAWLGRFSPEKGAHLAIEAAERAGMPIVLAGTIDRYRQESLRYFHDVIEPKIDNKQVKYIGSVNLKQKLHLLGRAYGFLNPIEWEEPFGMVMLEAMAVGCPVISFARGAAPEIVVSDKTGFLVRDVDEMVAAIPRLEEINRDATRSHVQQNFSVGVMAENYTQVYQQVIAARKDAAHHVSPDGSPGAEAHIVDETL
ncbi:MAG: glycosyltransferase family 4 protein [Chloroflexota bacterium]|nr:glycosyltransferase family 4 protein [Chloroflexota bacterium]